MLEDILTYNKKPFVYKLKEWISKNHKKNQKKLFSTMKFSPTFKISYLVE